MKINNQESLKYELGVLMFNAYKDSEVDEKLDADTMSYDIYGNFTGILNSLELNIDDLKEGFLAEGQNYNLSNEKLEEMFEKAKELNDMQETEIVEAKYNVFKQQITKDDFNLIQDGDVLRYIYLSVGGDVTIYTKIVAIKNDLYMVDCNENGELQEDLISTKCKIFNKMNFSKFIDFCYNDVKPRLDVMR